MIFALMEATSRSRLTIPAERFPELAAAQHLWE